MTEKTYAPPVHPEQASSPDFSSKSPKRAGDLDPAWQLEEIFSDQYSSSNWSLW